MISFRALFCVALLGIATGCGDVTSAQTVDSDADRASVVEAGAGDVSGLSADRDSAEGAAASVSGVGGVVEEPSANSAINSEQTTVVAETNAEVIAVQAAAGSRSDVRLESRSLLDGAVTLNVPSAFRVMSQANREKRYAAGQRPSLVLTNQAADVNIAFNLTRNAMSPQQLPDFQRQMASLFRAQVEADDWVDSSTITINGLDWFTIEMRTEAFSTKVWNLIAGTSVNGQLLLISFNATTAQEDAWKPVCRQMLGSVRLAAESIKQPEISVAD